MFANPVLPDLYWQTKSPQQMICELYKTLNSLIGYTNKLSNYYVPQFKGEWSAESEYDPNDLVVDESGNTWVALKPVPKGTPLEESEYWHLAYPYSAQFEQLKETVEGYQQLIDKNTQGIAQNAQGIAQNASDIVKLRNIAARRYDTVSDMVSDQELADGDIAVTAGFHTVGIGPAMYIIQDTGTENGMDVIACQNGLYAVKLDEEVIYPDSYGAIGDGSADDTEILQYCLDKGTVCINRNYSIKSTVYMPNSVVDGGGYINVLANMDTAIQLGRETQIMNKVFFFRVNANALAQTAVAVNVVKASLIKIRVDKAGSYGINTNIAATGNNENIFMLNVAGNNIGTTQSGILLNSADSIYLELISQDCINGVTIGASNAYIFSIHSWISDGMNEIIWDNSKVLNLGAYICNVGWLYQDSVKYGVYGAGLCHIDYLEYNNTHTEPSDDFINIYSETASKTKVVTYVNNLNENEMIRYSVGSLNTSAFGVENNGVSNNPNTITNTFTDANDAPSTGNFYVRYTVTNIPVSNNGYLMCSIVGGALMQVYVNVNVTMIQFRICPYNGTWSEWKQIYRQA